MTAPIFRIETWADVSTAISRLQIAGADHRVPVLQALLAGRIGFWEPQREGSSRLTKQFLAQVRLPAVVILGDDDDTPTGPNGWPVAERLLRWARQVIVHGTGGEPEHYVAAVMAAEIVGRLVIVECTSATVEAWKTAACRWARHATIQALQVPAPGVHPVPRQPGELH